MNKEKKTIPYRPSSGTEGMIFEENWCCNCEHRPLNPNEGHCDISMDMFFYDIDDPEYPKEIILKNDMPVCTSFKKRDILKKLLNQSQERS
jgi:hypothetical protein